MNVMNETIEIEQLGHFVNNFNVNVNPTYFQILQLHIAYFNRQFSKICTTVLYRIFLLFTVINAFYIKT